MPFDVRSLVDLRRVTAAVPSPDGTWLAVAVSRHDRDAAKYVSDLWRVPLDGGEPLQLTRSRYTDTAPAFRSDGSLGFLSNRPQVEGKAGESEPKRTQVWLLPAKGGEPRQLTDEPLGVSAFTFARRADRLIAVAAVLLGVPYEEQRARAEELDEKGPSALRFDRMPVRFWDRWLPRSAPHWIAYDGDGQDRRDLTPEADREHREAEWDLSADGRRLVITRGMAGAPDRLDDHALLVIDVDDGASRLLGAHVRENYGHPRFAPDGSTIACTHHVRGTGRQGGQRLRLVEVDSGAERALAPDWDTWAAPEAWSEDGRHIVCSAPWRGAQPVFRVDATSGLVERVTSEADGGSHTNLSVRGDRVYGLRARLTHPPEPFAVDMAADASPELVASLSGFTEEDGKRIAHVSSFEATSDDGVAVHSFVLAPHGANNAPTLLWIHGGPMSFWGDGWHWRWNPLVAVEAGYVVALPNPRGSTGYGQDFIEGIWGNVWGAQCFRDLMRVVADLEKMGAVDPSRLAAMGGSFGGYMTNWIGGQSDRFRCLITHASVYSMSAFHGVTDMPAYWAYAMGGVPYPDPEGFDEYSPSRYIDQWKAPTLVIHGEKDYRVPISEGLALFEALQHHGVPSELLVFPDENHWIVKPRNIVAWYEAVLEFLGRWMTTGR